MSANNPDGPPLPTLHQPAADALYRELTALVEDNLRRAVQDQPPDLNVCRPLADRLATAVASAPVDWMTLALRHQSTQSFLVTHPVNVAILMLELGLGWKSSAVGLVDLALLGLLHDVGIAKMQDVVTQPRPLTTAEREAMERHVALTHELLSRVPELSPDVVQAATQDHERINGSGYPAKRRKPELEQLGNLLAVTDMFEAMTHDRPHRAARAPYVVLRELMTAAADALDAEFLKLLIFQLGVYPIGSWVELSSREIARVIETRPETPIRPLVEVIADSSHHWMTQRRLVDLSAIPGLTIKRWLDEATVRRAVSGIPPA